MNLYGLIGFSLSHSFSAQYFNKKIMAEKRNNCFFQNFEIKDITFLPEIIEKNKQLKGFSVTIPYKEVIFPYLHKISKEAKTVGAVNCVKVEIVNGKQYLIGYNTDITGFENSIKPLLKPHHTKALILGTGGAAKAVDYVLNKLNIATRFVSRKHENGSFSYTKLLTENILDEYFVIVNATPLGMFPNNNDVPNIDFQKIGNQHLLFDLIYNPEKTLFLEKGEQNGATIKNGYQMLCIQADEAWNIWNETEK